ncbi:hypothetical protein [Clostridium felsineum]|uniref:hypothetical protein n=1 Tax=Clostridium felsineum TaxID=36839 RepID=UPI00098C4B50|nr:hypothetical protein [Clostridium felsineum]URZ18705.1 hypothetical protein CLFE_047930 [Clostridium felsineum DSM 794]
MVILFSAVCIVITIYEAPTLYKNAYYKDLIVFLSLMLIALVFGILYFFDLPVPNPLALINFLVKDVLHLNYK